MIYLKWCCLLGFLFIFISSPLAAKTGIDWKTVHPPKIEITTKKNTALKNILELFLQKYAVHPDKIKIDSSISGSSQIDQIEGRNPATIFNLLLSRHDLSLVSGTQNHRVVLRKDTWRHQPFRKTVQHNLSLNHLLLELSKTGKINIRFDQNAIKNKMIQRSLNYTSIEKAVFDLAQRQNALVIYYPNLHILEWTQDPPLMTKIVILETAAISKAKVFMEKIQREFEELQLVHIAYPTKNTLIIRGTDSSVSLAAQLIENWEKGLAKTEFMQSQNSIIFEDEVDEKPKLKVKQSPLMIRLPLKYLSVSNQTIQSNGKSFPLPGVEERLNKALQQKLEDETEIPENRPQIISDLLSNSLIITGNKSHIDWMKQLVKLWDYPLPLIQIEAHIFETSESYSRRLGLEFRGQSVAGDGTILSENQGAFTAGLAFGSAISSPAMKIEATLRLLQNEGKGRMLSRPVVVTLNNVEAEMNSGSVLHIKIVSGDNGRLHELKTGVTLRVTPRLIENSDNQSNTKIWLNIFAEASNPTEGTSIDGIPPINTQRAKTQVYVKNGQPFLLGGLIKNRTGQSQSGVPLFKDLPLIGPLFRTSGADNRFDHVLVFVTPTQVMLDQKQYLPEFKDMESKNSK